MKFDMGGRALLNTMPMANAALKQIIKWNVNNIYNTLTYYNSKVGNKLKEYGFKIVQNDEYGHILGVKFDENVIDSNELLDKLKSQNIYASVRGNAIRIAPHLHLYEHEYDLLVNCITSVMHHSLNK